MEHECNIPCSRKIVGEIYSKVTDKINFSDVFAANR